MTIERLLHDRAQRALASGLGMDLAADDHQRTAGFHDLANGDQALAHRRCEQVELVFGRQDARIGREQREARVAARGIDDRADDPRVDVAVLLRQVVAIR